MSRKLHSSIDLLCVTLAMVAAACVVVPAMADSCRECHDQTTRPFGHPVGVAAPVRGAESLPTEGGEITCTTCHVRHGYEIGAEGAEAVRESGERGRFFLRDEPIALCARCHRDGAGRWDRPHAMYADTVHGGTRLAGRTLDPRDGIDGVSRRCISCHDDSRAAGAGFESHVTGELGRSHPIGVEQAAWSKPNRHLVPASQVDQRVRLFGGRVGCGSCHSVFSRREQHLAAERRGSRLCFGCHEM